MNTNGEIKIDKGIPIPNRTGGRNRKYPVGEMGIGDSFLCESKTRINVAGWHKSMAPKRFVTRKTEEGWRIWRIA